MIIKIRKVDLRLFVCTKCKDTFFYLKLISNQKELPIAYLICKKCGYHNAIPTIKIMKVSLMEV